MSTGGITGKILSFAKSKLNTVVKYGKNPTGKCEELVLAALDHASAERGLNVLVPKSGDIAIFNNHKGDISIDILVSGSSIALGEIIDGVEADFKRGNHIAIVATQPDSRGKIYIFEQNIGKSKRVFRSPLNLKTNVSYSIRMPRKTTSFIIFKIRLRSVIDAEFTKEKADAAKKSINMKNLKLWFKQSGNNIFFIRVKYKGWGSVQFSRPQKK